MNTYIWVKPKYSKLGIKELVRIIYNPYKRSAKSILQEWVLPEFLHECYAINHN